MKKERLEECVRTWIDAKREESWLDFKEMHHENKADLVHDILCMANHKERRDSYIVFGVEDNSFNIKGLENCEGNRRNQQGITDIIKSLLFVGGVRPSIEMYTIKLNGHELDVLTIKDSTHVPYYLGKEYSDQTGKRRCVKPYHIYSRVGDTNTPINAQADIDVIENLWRKRFGIDLSVLERLHVRLEEYNSWVHKQSDNSYWYHETFPEFTIVKTGEWEQEWVPAAAFYSCPKMFTAALHILYHGTLLYETELWCFDDGRKILPQANTCLVDGVPEFRYSYYMKDSINGKLLRIFTGGSFDISSRESFHNQILIFENEEEKSDFDKYIKGNFTAYTDKEILEKYESLTEEIVSEYHGKMVYSPQQVVKAALLYESWRLNSGTSVAD